MRDPYKKVIFIGFLFLFSAIPTSWAQQSLVLEPQKDNTLYESESGTISNGAGSYLFAGRTAAQNDNGLIRRAVLAFDIAGSISAGATIDSVRLTMNMSKTVAGTVSMSLHRLVRNWGEGTSNAGSNEGSGTAASSGDATWLYAYYDTSSWAQPGGDFDTAALATQNVGGVGFYTWGTNAAMQQVVQSWLDNPAENFGWLLRGDETSAATAKRFDSKENATSGNRPQLTVYFTPSVSAISVISDQVPQNFALAQNYPNPFNPSTRIDFDIARAGNVSLTIYNLLGKKVITLFEGFVPPNSYSMEWNGKNSLQEDMPTGFYFYLLQSGNYTASRRMLLVR